MKKIAIHIDNSELNRRADEDRSFVIFESDGNSLSKKQSTLPGNKMANNFQSWIASEGITDLICFRIDKSLVEQLAVLKVQLFVGIRDKKPELIMEDYLNGKLCSDTTIMEEK
jgi:RNA-binding protein YhbY